MLITVLRTIKSATPLTECPSPPIFPPSFCFDLQCVFTQPPTTSLPHPVALSSPSLQLFVPCQPPSYPLAYSVWRQQQRRRSDRHLICLIVPLWSHYSPSWPLCSHRVSAVSYTNTPKNEHTEQQDWPYWIKACSFYSGLNLVLKATLPPALLPSSPSFDL